MCIYGCKLTKKMPQHLPHLNIFRDFPITNRKKHLHIPDILLIFATEK